MGMQICQQCGASLDGYRSQARFCSPAHRAAFQRSQIANKRHRVRFLKGATGDKAEGAPGYESIVRDDRYPTMFRLKRTDGTLSDMVNLTRAKDALASWLVIAQVGRIRPRALI